MNDFLDYYSRQLEALAKANALNKPIVFDALESQPFKILTCFPGLREDARALPQFIRFLCACCAARNRANSMPAARALRQIWTAVATWLTMQRSGLFSKMVGATVSR
jgi:hypothetical protein